MVLSWMIDEIKTGTQLNLTPALIYVDSAINIELLNSKQVRWWQMNYCRREIQSRSQFWTDQSLFQKTDGPERKIEDGIVFENWLSSLYALLLVSCSLQRATERVLRNIKLQLSRITLTLVWSIVLSRKEIILDKMENK